MAARAAERPLGVFDSGVGGLTVFHALERALPDESLVYLGDTARVPYGTKSAETVRRYAREAARFLARQDVKMIVVACNTAASVALDDVARESGLPVIGVILPGAARAVERSRTGRIGVIGTRSTIDSGAYERAIRERRADAVVVGRPCPLFVPLAEEGWTDDEVARRVAEVYLEPLRAEHVDTLVLGCTHYPLLTRTIAAVMGPEVQLVDSAEVVAAEVRERLREDDRLAGEGGAGRPEHHFYVTDVAGPFRGVAERFLGRAIRRPERATLDAD